MKRITNRKLYWLFAVMVFACKEKYTLPPNVTGKHNFLVVEGYINVGQDTTFIHLTHSRGLNDTAGLIVETGANLAVESDAGGSYQLIEQGNGNYYVPFIAGSNDAKYRLVINTGDGKRYESDFVQSKVAPAIDSISWEEKQDGVHIYTNTHDDEALSKYYKWDYIETYEYHSPFNSYFKLDPPATTNVVPRLASEHLNVCYQTMASTGIFIASTTKLSKDEVYKNQLVFIPVSTKKIGVLYSILVKQHTLTTEGFDYWQTLARNTENLGSLFDAQPSTLTGNIRCTSNPDDPVLGFITASTVQEKRIFIDKRDLGFWNYPYDAFSVCDTVHISSADRAHDYYVNFQYVPVNYYEAFNFFAAPVSCIDCRTEGGTLNKPPFWP